MNKNQQVIEICQSPVHSLNEPDLCTINIDKNYSANPEIIHPELIQPETVNYIPTVTKSINPIDVTQTPPHSRGSQDTMQDIQSVSLSQAKQRAISNQTHVSRKTEHATRDIVVAPHESVHVTISPHADKSIPLSGHKQAFTAQSNMSYDSLGSTHMLHGSTHIPLQTMSQSSTSHDSHNMTDMSHDITGASHVVRHESFVPLATSGSNPALNSTTHNPALNYNPLPVVYNYPIQGMNSLAGPTTAMQTQRVFVPTQVEQPTAATPFQIAQPNTGYVSQINSIYPTSQGNAQQTPNVPQLYFPLPIPPFTLNNAHSWFQTLETTFKAYNITNDTIKYAQALTHLDEQSRMLIQQRAEDNGEESYALLKKTVLDKSENKNRRRVIKCLTDTHKYVGLTPHNILLNLRQDTRGTNLNEKDLTEIFLEILPENISATLITIKDKPLQELADIAERLQERSCKASNHQQNSINSDGNTSVIKELSTAVKCLQNQLRDIKETQTNLQVEPKINTINSMPGHFEAPAQTTVLEHNRVNKPRPYQGQLRLKEHAVNRNWYKTTPYNNYYNNRNEYPTSNTNNYHYRPYICKGYPYRNNTLQHNDYSYDSYPKQQAFRTRNYYNNTQYHPASRPHNTAHYTSSQSNNNIDNSAGAQKQDNTCYYHQRFGGMAYNCLPGCTYSGN